LINQNLHRNPVPLDSNQHRQMRVALPVTDWSVASRLNSIFVAGSEFSDVCREFPIVFVRAGKAPDGKDQIAPIAVLGLTQEQNLYLASGRWRARYMPVALGSYPFCIGRIDEQRFAVCVDMAWSGVSQAGAAGAADTGRALFEGDGKPAPLLQEMQKHFETFEAEVVRTRLAGARLQELGLLRDMRFDATLPDGRRHSVDGFLTVDEAKVQQLPDDVVGELHRNGLLGLIHRHWVSMGNMHRLLDWHVERSAAAAPPSAPAPTAAVSA
jgi:SapC